MRFGLVSVNIKLQKDYLNVNPACSACLCVNKRAAQMHNFVYYTQATEMHVFSTSAARTHERQSPELGTENRGFSLI